MGESTEPTTSNAFALTSRQWIGLAVFTAALYLLAPVAWRRVEKLETGPDYRIPYELSSDYWLWSRIAERDAASYDTMILGDSVVWGQYVRPEETLSHYLNMHEGAQRYANLGLDGAYPAALVGLIESYGKGIQGKRVLLQCNPLWMSSPMHDLRESEETKLNHLALVPQFSPSIPCYKEEVSRRIGKVVERNVPFNSWTSHLQAAYFGSSNIPRWTLEHPYENPLQAVTGKLPPSGDELRHEPISWSARGITKQNMPWVDLPGSLQWASFRRAVDVLQKRGNTVMVVVGPFNEHLLTDASREKYAAMKRGIEDWLKERGIPWIAPTLLPSDYYGDASHPLSAGYALLAKELVSEGFLAAAEKKPER
ncbi:MAG TPA: hypothetical protein VG457_14330 [Planctomycetota bacterium]|jgi:hypothetical protein|nr:hypothetical protein [Planctomycetota bacterium]